VFADKNTIAMTISELEKGIAQRTYDNATGMKVTFTSYDEDRNCGAIKVMLADGSMFNSEYYINQEYETIYLSILENQYVFQLKEGDDQGIVAFDLLQGEEVVHSFRLFS
jgi:hypothetical protein